jgi:ABC-type polar amino acid transport system ATPase subunit
MLEAKNIEKSFGSTNVLVDINLKLPLETITVLTGPSGSGKSTLIRCLSLLDHPCKGEIIIDDKRYFFPTNRIFNEKDIYPKLTCVFQQLYLWPHLSNFENILLPLKGNCNLVALEYYIELFNIREVIDKYPNESSLGQRQRVSLIRALMLRPKYLLLDEITSALDSVNTEIVISELSKFVNDGRSILLISHDYRVVSNNNHNFMLLENGKLIPSNI